jgi:hypothetical protein
LSFVEVGMGIYVGSYILLNANCAAPFFPEVRLSRNFIIQLMLKRGFNRLKPQKPFDNLFTKGL